jgi:hypothetical protein
LEASDKGQITVKLSRDSHYADEYVEVIGKVQDDDTIQEFTSMNMGNNISPFLRFPERLFSSDALLIDMDLVEAVVQLSAQFPDIFPTE